jgi:1-acyl-sn-glycerol-3-phosphate acyltransferase
MKTPPLVLGTANLPQSARFLLAANHYQRKGLWILHPAAALTHAIRQHYGPGDPPVRWIVTANWPRIKVGPFSFPSPGDLVLPRVAEAWSCYPVCLHGVNPAYSARNLRRILRDLPYASRPLGLFPEGVRGSAGHLSDSLPGVERFIVLLAGAGVPVVPAAISESGRLILRFGKAILPEELRLANNSGVLVLSRIQDLLMAKGSNDDY